MPWAPRGFDGGPARAVEAFLLEYWGEYEVDNTAARRHGFSQSDGGILRRVEPPLEEVQLRKTLYPAYA